MSKRAKSEGAIVKTGVPTVRFHCNATKVVHDAFARHGYEEVDIESDKFTYLWGWPSAHELIRRLQPGQMVNQISGQFCLTRKDNLAQTIQEFLRNHKDLPEFIPKTFVLPANEILLCSYMQQHTKRYFIVKEALANRGEGIEIIRGSQKWSTMREAVVQEYIKKPLLINGYKFDFRVYVLVLSVDPLVVYRYDEGLARFATTAYERPTLKTRGNLQQHLTNYSVNKERIAESESEDSDGAADMRSVVGNPGELRQPGFSFKQKMSSILQFLEVNSEVAFGRKSSEIEAQIDEIIRYVSVAAEPKMSAHACAAHATGLPRKSYGFLGYDLICDQRGSVQLLEVNACPSTACETPVDWEIKEPLFYDLVGLTGPKRFFIKDKLVVQTLAQEDTHPKDKGPRRFSKRLGELKEALGAADVKQAYKEQIKPGLTEFEQKLLLQLRLDERKKGAFKRLIPNADAAYLRYFEQAKPADLLAALFCASGEI